MMKQTKATEHRNRSDEAATARRLRSDRIAYSETFEDYYDSHSTLPDHAAPTDGLDELADALADELGI